MTFKSLNKNITKLCGIAGSLKETTLFKSEVKILADKIRGFKTKKNHEPIPDDASEWDHNYLSYAMRTDNYKKLICLLASSASYKPNEADFSIGSLNAEYEKMRWLNIEIDHIIAKVNKARTDRNKALYDAETGVLEIMKACRSYVKGLFGTGSKEYKMLSAIKFRVLPKKYNTF